MLETLNAIQSAFNANTALAAAFPNGLETLMGQDAEALPLCILSIVSLATDYSTASEHNGSTPLRAYIETMDWQITVYSTDPAFCVQMLDQLYQTFDHQKLTLATEKWLDTRRLPGLGRLTRDDERVARGDAQFTTRVQRQLGS